MYITLDVVSVVSNQLCEYHGDARRGRLSPANSEHNERRAPVCVTEDCHACEQLMEDQVRFLW